MRDARYGGISNVGSTNLPAGPGDGDGGFVVLPTDASSGMMIITNTPTPQPSKAAAATTDKCGTGQAVARTDCDPSPTMTSAANNNPKAEVTVNEYSCTGEPCIVETWCRSQYGSCGPGFVYCNTYSTWRDTCPPVVPGNRPTRTPLPGPTWLPEPYSHASLAMPGPGEISCRISVNAPSAPSELPRLPGPTMPTIPDGGTSYPAEGIVTQSWGAHSDAQPEEEKEGDDAWESFLDKNNLGLNGDVDANKEDEGTDDEEDEEKEKEVNDPRAEEEKSYTGLNEWLDFTGEMRSNGSLSTHCAFRSGLFWASSFCWPIWYSFKRRRRHKYCGE